MTRRKGTQAVAVTAPSEEARHFAEAIAHAGLERKAEEVVVIDVRGLTSYADFFVLMTGNSDRQVQAIADGVEEKSRADGQRPLGVEGYEGGHWVLLDFGDVVAHVFYRDARGFYDLDGLWADAPKSNVA